MPDYVIKPLVGVGPVLLGMTRDEVRRAMPEPSTPFRKVSTAKYETDSFHKSAFQVYYSGDQPTVEFIELSSDPIVHVLYGELDIFNAPADEVIAYVSRDAEYDRSDPEIPYSYLFRGLELSLWRPLLPEDENDSDGRCFATIGIGRRGYYGEG